MFFMYIYSVYFHITFTGAVTVITVQWIFMGEIQSFQYESLCSDSEKPIVENLPPSSFWRLKTSLEGERFPTVQSDHMD